LQNQGTKRVLIITYYWPPSGGAGVQRWLKFSKYLPEFGWTPVIYTPQNPEAPATDNSLFKDIPESAIIIKKPIWEPYLLYKWFTGKSKNEKINAGFLTEKKSNPFLEKISVFIRGNFFIPDARKFWIRPSVKYLVNYLKQNRVDVMVSTGPPHSMHLIALGVKKKLNIKWIADFRDPWTNIDFYKDLKLTRSSNRKHKHLENEVLTNADIVIAIGKTFSEELKSLGAKNIEVITNGFDQDDLPLNKPQLDSNFSIVHLGAINKDRNHPVFWKAIKELIQENKEFKERLEIRFVGKVDNAVFQQIKDLQLSSFINYLPYVSHDQVFNELLKARLLFLPINNTPNSQGIVTGKVFEYLASQRPILAVGPTDGDVSDILKETGVGHVFDFNDLSGIKGFITKNFSNFINQTDSSSAFNVDMYSRKSLTDKLCKLFEKQE
jgi:glycosyltransferase involved in cell wall biosynthesis